MNNKEYAELSEKVLTVYQYAEQLVNEGGFNKQVDYLKDLMETQPYRTISVEQFFREYTWVVFTCGFKAAYVQKYWKHIKKMCCDFDISKAKELSFEELLEVSPIKNKKKLKAIEQSFNIIDEYFIEEVHKIKDKDEAKNLFKTLPFIGEITVYHIMRNVGIDCFKPDRHIVHITKDLKISEEDLFETIRSKYKEYIGVIDYILWRASSTLHNISPNSSLVEMALKGEQLDEIPKNDFMSGTYLF
jgi:endonuclease III